MRFLILCFLLAFLFHAPSFAQKIDHQHVIDTIDGRFETYSTLAHEIWELAEVGYQEYESAEKLSSLLENEGFTIERGVAEIPTAFVASYGNGSPVIGIMAEYDALPGISQAAVPTPQAVEAGGAGHACGHHLFGAGSTAAAIAVKDWLESGNGGTIRLYGTPAEEGGAGKVYMVRAGLFDDVDVVLHWHPSDRNDASPGTSLANRSAKFRFKGVSSHAAGAPERGRSALDGVEAMNYMVNLLREHVPQETRIHYVITGGGGLAPNVVPNAAEVYYYVRHPEAKSLEGIWERVVAASKGAAEGTGTEVEHEVIHGLHRLLPNEALAEVMDKNLRKVGGVEYSPEEKAFAEEIRKSFASPSIDLGSEATIQPMGFKSGGGSTDVGDVSWVVPTAGLNTATWVPGTSAHSWQAIAAGGTGIGHKGMIVAAKTLALTAIDLLEDEKLIESAREEFERLRGPDFEYYSLLGDRKPPLDYRN